MKNSFVAASNSQDAAKTYFGFSAHSDVSLKAPWLSLLFAPLSVVAIGLFVLGLISTFIGLCLVLAELRVSLEPLEFEHNNLKRLLRGEGLLEPEFQDQ